MEFEFLNGSTTLFTWLILPVLIFLSRIADQRIGTLRLEGFRFEGLQVSGSKVSGWNEKQPGSVRLGWVF